MTIARILICRPGGNPNFPTPPPALGDVSTDGPAGTWRRVTRATPGRPVDSVMTLVPVCTLTLAALPACVVEAYVDGDAAAFAAWANNAPAVLFVGTVVQFRAVFAAANAQGTALRAAWPAGFRRYAGGDVRPSMSAPGGTFNAGSAPSGQPRAVARLGLRAADFDDSAPDADADAPG